MNSHPQKMREQLTLFFDNRLNPADRQAFETHLSTCIECRDRLVSMQMLRADLKTLSTPEPGPAFYNKVMAEAYARRESHVFLRWPILSLSGVAGLAMIGLVLLSTREKEQTSRVSQSEMASVDSLKDQLATAKSVPVGAPQRKAVAQELASRRAEPMTPELKKSAGITPGDITSLASESPPQAKLQSQAANAFESMSDRGMSSPALPTVHENDFDLIGPAAQRRIRHKALPRYPAGIAPGASGSIRMYIRVNSEGIVNPEIRLIRTSGYNVLDQAALDAAKQWIFSPVSGDTWGVLTFNFTLNN